MKRVNVFSLKYVIVFGLLFLILLFAINSKPFGTPQLLETTGGQNILDMEMEGYTPDRAYEILAAMGSEGRAFQLNSILPLDFPFPLFYALFFFITITFLFSRAFPGIRKPWLIGLPGLIAGLFDWLENMMIIRLLNHYPERLDGVAMTSSLFTQCKSVFMTISMGLIVLGLILLLIKRLRQKSVSSQ